MRGTAPILTCDAVDGFCGEWEIDHYETGASSIGGVRLTSIERAPGWTSTEDGDFCRHHTPTPPGRPDLPPHGSG